MYASPGAEKAGKAPRSARPVRGGIPRSNDMLLYKKHVRVGRAAVVGYFVYPFKKPFWISRKVAFWLD